jgi:hypothetical protein
MEKSATEITEITEITEHTEKSERLNPDFPIEPSFPLPAGLLVLSLSKGGNDGFLLMDYLC